MNRSRYVDRLYLSRNEEGERFISGQAPAGTERAVGQAAVLAHLCSEDVLEALINHFAALNEFGGQLFIAAAREKFDRDGYAIGSGPGEHQTVGFVVNYNHRAQIKGQVQEPDAPLSEQEPPEAFEAEQDEPAPEVEAVPVEA